MANNAPTTPAPIRLAIIPITALSINMPMMSPPSVQPAVPPTSNTKASVTFIAYCFLEILPRTRLTVSTVSKTTAESTRVIILARSSSMAERRISLGPIRRALYKICTP